MLRGFENRSIASYLYIFSGFHVKFISGFVEISFTLYSMDLQYRNIVTYDIGNHWLGTYVDKLSIVFTYYCIKTTIIEDIILVS